MRKNLIKLCRFLSLALLLATFPPLGYAFVFLTEPSFGWFLYIRSFLILFPIIATERSICRAKSLTAYLFSSLLIFALTAVCSWLLGPLLSGNPMLTGYAVFMCAETVFLILCRYSIHQKRQEEFLNSQAHGENQLSFGDFMREGQAALDKPQISLIAVFIIAYVSGLFCQDSTLCNIALSGSICYLFLFLLYLYLQKTEEYLSLHKRVKSVPRKRIYGIGKSLFLLLTLFLLLGILPGLFTIHSRKYPDIKKWDIGLDIIEEDREDEINLPMEEPWFLSQEGIEFREPPKWLDYLASLITATCCLAFLAFVGNIIRQAFLDFRSGGEENGDIVENLTNDTTEKISSRISRRKLGENREEWSVRKKYRRTILRSRKEVPNPWESPAELEENAGLTQNLEMQTLHTQYEKARYGYSQNKSQR